MLWALGGLFSADLGCLGPPYLQRHIAFVILVYIVLILGPSEFRKRIGPGERSGHEIHIARGYLLYQGGISDRTNFPCSVALGRQQSEDCCQYMYHFSSRSASSSKYTIYTCFVSSIYWRQVGINLRQISTSSLPGQALPMFRGLMEGSNTEMADVVVVPWVG